MTGKANMISVERLSLIHAAKETRRYVETSAAMQAPARGVAYVKLA